ncbi:hypothetical protein E1B28_006503 [Marasmius oreades]|uniref:Yeast cell wall synthesis Kre9/Knh1-like N-terminal domain-containing protein n=1 Tax=Marasmius oreades TaxID=181124 RepID=A0A9P7S8L5_9AGAR|nr:uncharacterized protein E1B28_006503 [Marasmius oreades]KAG7095803.1 hypothetical protein E1B28_006503 [Marasmius oreades]
MHLSFLALALALLVALEAIVSVQASLYVIKPRQGDTCHGGEECIVEWLDDGTRPLLSSIGVTTIGLYTGTQQLVQNIPAVDVSEVQSFKFTPTPEAGPDSDTYYIAFSSTIFKQNGTSYLSFTPSFKLDRMTGSFSAPLDSATSPLEIPSSLTASTEAQTSSLSTVTVGTLSTSLLPLDTSTEAGSATTSRFSTMTKSPATPTLPSQSHSAGSGTNTTTGNLRPSQSSNGAFADTRQLVSLLVTLSVLSLCFLL